MKGQEESEEEEGDEDGEHEKADRDDNSNATTKRRSQDGDDEAKEKSNSNNDDGGDFQNSFDLEHRELSTTGQNRFFILEPGYQLVLGGKDGDRDARLEITVLDETREVGGIDTRVVEERESVDGELTEVSRNFYAICKSTGSVFYFGEDVDVYRNGEVVAHEGAWQHGRKGAHAGMMMPGECVLGAAFYQEFAPKQAMDRARIVGVDSTIKTPSGEYSKCLKVWEDNPLEGDSETKTYAPGIGLVQDENLLLVQFGYIKQSRRARQR